MLSQNQKMLPICSRANPVSCDLRAPNGLVSGQLWFRGSGISGIVRRIAHHRWTPLEDSLDNDRARSGLLTLRDELRFDAPVFHRGMDIQTSPRCVKVAIGPEFIL